MDTPDTRRSLVTRGAGCWAVAAAAIVRRRGVTTSENEALGITDTPETSGRGRGGNSNGEQAGRAYERERSLGNQRHVTHGWRQPNGSRLSCGRHASGRKVAERQTKRLASEATQFFPTCERPAASSAC